MGYNSSSLSNFCSLEWNEFCVSHCALYMGCLLFIWLCLGLSCGVWSFPVAHGILAPQAGGGLLLIPCIAVQTPNH